MRSDFIGDCARFPGLAETINAGLYLTPRLNREQLSEAIEEPPAVVGCDIEPALIRRLLSDAGQNPDHLPLLQHVLQWLWNQARERGEDPVRLTLDDYKAMGGFGKALSDRLDAIFENELNQEQKRIAEILFRNLSRRDAEQRDIRRPVRLDRVSVLARTTPDAVMGVVERFRGHARNFIMPYAGPLTLSTLLDVSHESLLRQWKRLRQWLEDEARSAEIYQRLEQAALRHERAEGDLLARLDLANARAWWEDKNPNAWWAERHGMDQGRHFELTRAFLDASIRAERARLRRRNGLILLLLTFICAVFLVLWIQLEKTKDAEGKAVAAHVKALKSQMETLKAKEEAEMSGRRRTEDLFESQLTHASLLAKVEDYAAAWKTLVKTRKLDGEIAADRRHARNLMAWFADLMGERADRVYDAAGAVLMDVAVSPDGATLAAVGERGTVALLDERTAGLLARLEGHDTQAEFFGIVRSAAFHPDGRWLATAGDDSRVILWSMPGGEMIRQWRAPAPIRCIAPSPDGAILATTGADDFIIQWDVESGASSAMFKGHKNYGVDLRFIDNGRRLLSASMDRTLRLWDTESGVTLRVLQGHQAGVIGLAAMDGAMYSAANDGTVRRWRGDQRDLAVVDLRSELAAADICPDGDTVAVGFASGDIGIYSIAGDRFLWRNENGHRSKIKRVAFSPDGLLVASCGFDNTIRLWDAATGHPVQTFAGHMGAVHALAFSPDGNAIASAGYDGGIGLFRIGEESGQFHHAHDGEAFSVAFSDDGQCLVSAGLDGAVRLWSIGQWPPTLIREYPKSSERTMWAAISPGGERIAAVGRDNLVHVFDAENGEEIYAFAGHEQTVYRAEFTPDGGQVVTVSADATVRFWDLKTETPLFRIELPAQKPPPVPLWDFAFRCTPGGDCRIAVPLTNGHMVLYRMANIYPPSPTQASDNLQKGPG